MSEHLHGGLVAGAAAPMSETAAVTPAPLPDLASLGVRGRFKPTGRGLVWGHLTGPRFPLRPQVFRGGRVILGASALRHSVFVGRLEDRSDR